MLLRVLAMFFTSAGKQPAPLSVAAVTEREEEDAMLRGLQGRYQGTASSSDAGNSELWQQVKSQHRQRASYLK